MKVLVTGGSSRLGGYVPRELLEHSHTLSNFGRTAPYVPGLTHVLGDFGDRVAVRGHEGWRIWPAFRTPSGPRQKS